MPAGSRIDAPALPETLPAGPMQLLEAWLQAAVGSGLQRNANAMVLATADVRGAPSARVVLCKQIRPEPGYVTFFTNYRSRKGRELEVNPRAAAVMHWDALGRQVRIEGPVVPVSPGESDDYFSSRSWQSRLGAWASAQSEPIGSRAAMLQALERTARRFGAEVPGTDASAPDPGLVIPRPPHWGGYHLWAEQVELWVESFARLHDRARWTRTLTPGNGSFEPGPWSATRLQP